VEAVYEGLSIGSDQDRTDRGNAGRISGDELLPEGSFPGGEIHAVDFGGNFSGLIYEQTAAILTKTRRKVARLESGNRSRLALPRGGVEISLQIRPYRRHHLAIGRNGEGGSVHPFGCDGCGVASAQILRVQSSATTRFISCEHKLLAVRQPPGAVVVDRVIG
jgi:hypothetical protein